MSFNYELKKKPLLFNALLLFLHRQNGFEYGLIRTTVIKITIAFFLFLTFSMTRTEGINSR